MGEHDRPDHDDADGDKIGQVDRAHRSFPAKPVRRPDLARGQYWIHPGLSEVVENALLKLPLGPATSPAG